MMDPANEKKKERVPKKRRGKKRGWLPYAGSGMTQSLAGDMQHNNRTDHGDEGIIVFIMEHEMR